MTKKKADAYASELIFEIFKAKLTPAGTNNNGVQKVSINIPKKVLEYAEIKPGMLAEVTIKIKPKKPDPEETKEEENIEEEVNDIPKMEELE